VLRMGIVFAIFGGFFYWFPLFTGLVYSEYLAKLHFYFTFFSVNLTFFPQHFLGLAGMPRRYSDYPDCFITYNKLSSIGSLLTVISVILFVLILWEAFVSQRTLRVVLIPSSHLEWLPASHPLGYHTFSKPINCFTWSKKPTVMSQPFIKYPPIN
jgi:cytochrome c oxidase subunit 1